MSGPRESGRLQSGARARASSLQHIESMTDKIIRLFGLVDTVDIGEALIDVTFPVKFLELPSYSFGWHLGEGQVVELGLYPTGNMGVHSFTYDEDPTGLRYYTGAKLIIVVTGLVLQRTVFHYQFEGRAIVPPITTDHVAEDTV